MGPYCIASPRIELCLERETGLDPWTAKAWCDREKVQRVEVPMGEGWRIQYLSKLQHAKKDLEIKCLDVEEINFR